MLREKQPRRRAVLGRFMGKKKEKNSEERMQANAKTQALDKKRRYTIFCVVVSSLPFGY